MLKKISSANPTHLTFLLIPHFSLIALTSVIEPMRIANRMANKTLYTWELTSKDGDPVTSSSGTELTVDCDISSITHASNIIVSSGIDAHLYHDLIVFGYLRRWSTEGAYLGAICTGAHVLASAGLLTGYDCTIHWENIDSFIEKFPMTKVQTQLFTIDRDRFTCAGGIAGIDMMLQEIKNSHGEHLANIVSEQFMHERIRDSNDTQKLPLQTRLKANHPKLIQAVSRMEENTENPLSKEDIAKEVNLSHRQLERLFKKYLNTSPAKYYLTLRLKRANILLTQTTMAITEIAFASGFASASHFSQCYKEMFSITPREERHITKSANITLVKEEVNEVFQQILEGSIDTEEL